MKITNTTLNQFREDFKKAMKDLEEKYEVQINAGKITYDNISFTFTVKVVNGTDEVEANRITFENNLKGTYLEKEDFLRSFVAEGRTYTITGINPKGRKHPIIIKDVVTGKEYSCGPEYIPFAKKRKEDLYRRIYSEIEQECK